MIEVRSEKALWDNILDTWLTGYFRKALQCAFIYYCCFILFVLYLPAIGSVAKESACNVGDLGWDDPLEEGWATHSSILVWRIPMHRGAWRAIAHGVPKRPPQRTTQYRKSMNSFYLVSSHQNLGRLF